MSAVPDISLALHAVRQEGREPHVVPWSWWREHAEPGIDYLVLQDDTWRAHAEARAGTWALQEGREERSEYWRASQGRDTDA